MNWAFLIVPVVVAVVVGWGLMLAALSDILVELRGIRDRLK